jgi:hypothetical protein
LGGGFFLHLNFATRKCLSGLAEARPSEFLIFDITASDWLEGRPLLPYNLKLTLRVGERGDADETPAT